MTQPAANPPLPPAEPAGVPYEGDAVVVLDEVVRSAVAKGASDIHLEPKRDRLQVRFRVDGVMVEQPPIDLELSPRLVSRIKVLSRMDIYERRTPQDGQFTVEAGLPSPIHLRASTFPSSQGEKVVMRILLGHSLIAFDRLGMDETTQGRVREIVTRPQGFVVSCGPAGSGKTTSLYAFLQNVDTGRLNVVTLEDPIEVELYTITQGQTNTRAGFTFATGLRSILRQDPNVILVGEVRDAETAGIALQAALTGHLVMSTLHTSDTVDTIVRLVDLGIEPWIVANAITAVLAQRLVRVVCPGCRQTAPLEADFWDGDELMLLAGSDVVRPRGCKSCHFTGYRSRTGIFQLLEIDDEIRDLVKAKASATAYRAILKRRRVPSLRRVGLEKVQAGITTIDEVVRVTT